MLKKALVVIDIQNEITKNYKDIIDNINKAVDWAANNGVHVVYIRHENLSPGTRTLKPNTKGAELVPELKMVSTNIFTKYKTNALTSEEFAAFISDNGINEFYIVGADATICVKSTIFNLRNGNQPHRGRVHLYLRDKGNRKAVTPLYAPCRTVCPRIGQVSRKARGKPLRPFVAVVWGFFVLTFFDNDIETAC